MISRSLPLDVPAEAELQARVRQLEADRDELAEWISDACHLRRAAVQATLAGRHADCARLESDLQRKVDALLIASDGAADPVAAIRDQVLAAARG